MEERGTTKEQLVRELNALHERNKELEKREAERIRTEAALRESEEKWRSVVEKAPHTIIIVDRDGTIQFINRTVPGFTVEGTIGTKVYDYTKPEYHDVERDNIERVFEQGTAGSYVVKGIGPENRDAWYETMIGPLRRDGKIIAATLIVTEITERKQTEEALRESEEKYRTLVENVNIGVYRNTGGPRGRFLQANPAIAKMFGYDFVEDFMEMAVADLYQNPAERKLFVEEALQKGFVKDKELRLHKKDGTPIWASCTAKVQYDEQGGIKWLDGVIEDITERKRFQERLEKLTEGFLSFRADPNENINHLTALTGQLLGGTYALYNRLSSDMLCTLGQWQVPPDYDLMDRAEGHICYNVIQQAHDAILIVRNLPETPFAATDPNVMRYGLQTYMGKGVKCGDASVGALCVVYTTDYNPSDEDKRLLEIIASAIGVEEERKRAEDALRESEERFRTLVSNVPGMVYGGRRDWTVSFIGPWSVQISGYRPEEIKEGIVDWLDIIHPDDREHVVKEAAVLIDRPGSLEQEYRIIKKDGSMAWVCDIKRSRHRDGEFMGVDGVVLDITERKRAEEEVKKFKTIAENANYGVAISDLGGNIIYINDYFAGVHGYKAKEILGRNLKLFHNDEQLPEILKINQELQERGSYGAREVWHAHQDGSVFPMLMSGVLIKTEDGKPLFMAATAIDITERKQAEEALQASEARFREMAEMLPETIFELDDNGVLTFANQKGFEAFGYSREDFEAGLTALQMFVPGERERVKENIERIMRGEELGGIEYTAQRKDATAFPVITYTSCILQDGRPVGLRGIVVDMTELRKMEEELLRATKFESIALLAGGISHDFNNILTAILGNITLARTYVRSDDKVAEVLMKAERASLRAKDLTQQLLTFSTGGLTVTQPASIGELITDSASFALRGSNVTCQSLLSDDLWPVEVDEAQITQVINNLVINADQAMQEGGKIEIRAENVRLGSDGTIPLPAGDYVQISVKDTGSGIPEEHLPKIFDPFFTTKQKGSGLGLATTYSIVKKHNGYITVDSQWRVGTTFTIYLLASKKELPAEKLESKKEQVVVGRGRILVMDDEEMIRDVLGTMLKRIGYEVEFATEGNKAITLYTEARGSGQPFDAVILDLTVPGGMGGKEAVRKLLDIDPAARVIASSGYSNDPAIGEFRKYGFCGYVAKPFRIQELSKMLHSVLHSENG